MDSTLKRQILLAAVSVLGAIVCVIEACRSKVAGPSDGDSAPEVRQPQK